MEGTLPSILVMALIVVVYITAITLCFVFTHWWIGSIVGIVPIVGLVAWVKKVRKGS